MLTKNSNCTLIVCAMDFRVIESVPDWMPDALQFALTQDWECQTFCVRAHESQEKGLIVAGFSVDNRGEQGTYLQISATDPDQCQHPENLPDPEFPMVEGEGAPQYTFAPDNTQLSLL